MDELTTLVRYQRDQIRSRDEAIAALWMATLSLMGALMVTTTALVYILF